MPKIHTDALAVERGSSYPPPYAAICEMATWKKLGDAVGLTDFGVNLVRLEPGGWASQRHWHDEEDEFVLMLEGEVVLVEDEGETVLRPGDAAGWKAGVPNGHHLQNRSEGVAVYLEVGTRRPQSACHYPDIDMDAPAGFDGYTHMDGTPYPPTA